MEKLSEKLRYHKLYDIYSKLLTEKQKTYFEYYYLDDYSLSEIAKIMGVSRNAVHDQVKIVLQHLDHYEETLQISTHKSERLRILTELKSNTTDESILKWIKELEKNEV